MRVVDVLPHLSIAASDVRFLKNECSQFINESAGYPLYRALPAHYDSIKRVKVRHPKQQDVVQVALGEAITPRVGTSGVFAQAAAPDTNYPLEPFYIFPTNGYKFVYSRGVRNSNADLGMIFEAINSTSDAFDITTDLIRRTYVTTDLIDGIISESEIIFYNIPHFYALRVSHFRDYQSIINILHM